jgi:RNA polymerase sigma factor (sigma-70 family)
MDDQVEAIERCIGRLNAGDAAARAELLECAYAGLLIAVGKKLKHFARLARWEQPEDVRQDAAMKMWGALKDISPRTADEFWAMAGEQVRRVLLDLARHHFGPRRHAAYTDLPEQIGAFPAESADDNRDAINLDRWTALHEQIAQLPDDERKVVLAVWYCSLSLEAAARALGISADTAQRRWKTARIRLRAVLKGERPDG